MTTLDDGDAASFLERLASLSNGEATQRFGDKTAEYDRVL
jgi:hypothetical protein